jgi:DNA-binding CsgD family transcriptional regulator
MTQLIAESNSYNSLAKQLNLSVSTIRNNMNWDRGISYISDNGETVIYLKEKGVSLRSEALNTQLPPKDRYPLLNLKNRSLYDLIPGKIYAINADTLENFGIYDSQRELSPPSSFLGLIKFQKDLYKY